ncbi:hypothetical protein B0H19DRAFT_1299215 [Mycena capillaripes]|nr:hypothetical protein B0H19DRAFT_1299215 [Mycena capillaripes]
MLGAASMAASISGFSACERDMVLLRAPTRPHFKEQDDSSPHLRSSSVAPPPARLAPPASSPTAPPSRPRGPRAGAWQKTCAATFTPLAARTDHLQCQTNADDPTHNLEASTRSLFIRPTSFRRALQPRPAPSAACAPHASPAPRIRRTAHPSPITSAASVTSHPQRHPTRPLNSSPIALPDATRTTPGVRSTRCPRKRWLIPWR